jgi:hypothetical protein
MTSAQGAANVQVLFAAARARRQRVRFFVGALVMLLVAGALVGANINRLFGEHRSVGAGHPSDVPRTTTPSDPRSEVVTVAVASTPAADPYEPTEQLREAVTLGTSRPSAEILAANGIEFSDLPKLVGGVYYARATVGGVNGWQAFHRPIGTIAPALSPAAPANRLRFVTQLSTGPLKKVGGASVGGEPTTEYRLTVSVVKLYALATPAGALVSLVYNLTDPTLGTQSSASPQLSFPLDVWVDRDGHALRARTATAAVPPTFGYSRPATTYSVTLSNFGVRVEVAAPARRDLIEDPTIKSQSATVSGKVLVRTRAGRETTERGLLLFSTLVMSGFGARLKPFAQPLSIGPNGAYTATVLGSSASFPQPLRLRATFYPVAGPPLSCDTPAARRFPSGTASNGSDIVCPQ